MKSEAKLDFHPGLFHFQDPSPEGSS